MTLDEAATETVTVDYVTADGTAAAGTDYTSTTGTLTFDAGTTSQTISVSIADDTEDESDETFTVTLSNPSGADLGTATATGTIRSRTAVVATTPTLSIAGGSGTEGSDSSISFTVTLDEAATGTVTVDYATSDGTADAGDDYTSASGTLTICAGSSTGSIEVAVLDDEHNEGSETLTMTLSSLSGGVLTDATATGTITNHDALPAALTARFGRAAATHVIEQVEERVNARRAPGFAGRIAGRQVTGSSHTETTEMSPTRLLGVQSAAPHVEEE